MQRSCWRRSRRSRPSRLLQAVRRDRIPGTWARSCDPSPTRASGAGDWAAHLAVVEGDVIGEPQFETDRARFLGPRPRHPQRHCMRRRALFRHGRRRARSDLRHAPASAGRPGEQSGWRSGPWSPRRARSCWIQSTSAGTRRRSGEQRRSRGHSQVQLHHLGIRQRGQPVPALGRACNLRRADVAPASDTIRKVPAPSRGFGCRASQGISDRAAAISEGEHIDIAHGFLQAHELMADEAANRHLVTSTKGNRPIIRSPGLPETLLRPASLAAHRW